MVKYKSLTLKHVTMPILYYKTHCVFSRQVLAAIDRMELEVERRNLEENDTYKDEVVARGGKAQTPFLVDDAKGIEMYESDAIVAYLQKEYGKVPVATTLRPRVHVGGSTCVSCEG